jgi:hypothetical protein
MCVYALSNVNINSAVILNPNEEDAFMLLAYVEFIMFLGSKPYVLVAFCCCNKMPQIIN